MLTMESRWKVLVQLIRCLSLSQTVTSSDALREQLPEFQNSLGILGNVIPAHLKAITKC